MSDSIYMVHFGNAKTLGLTRNIAEKEFIRKFGMEAFAKATISEFTFNQDISYPRQY
jgi:hypothetical protein